MLVILFGVSWMSDTAAALQDADHDKKIEERLLSENQTLDEFFLNIYNFLNGDMQNKLLSKVVTITREISLVLDSYIGSPGAQQN